MFAYLFGYGQESAGHITVQDISDASRAINFSNEGSVQLQSESRKEFTVGDIGINNNKWRRPITELGRADVGLERQISQNEFLSDFDVDPGDWKQSVRIVNILLENVFLKEFKTQAESYHGLAVSTYVKQGSSREGLKVRRADEFDTVLLYEIKGLNYEAVHMESQPGLGMLKVSRWGQNMEELRHRYPQLARDGVFVVDGSDIYLSSRNLHEKVFESIIDSAIYEVEKKIVEASSKGVPVGFKINRQLNPPSINLSFIINSSDRTHDGRVHVARAALSVVQESRRYASTYQIDVDVVPGLQLKLETVPNPFNPRESMYCPVYAVFKWRNENQPAARLFHDPEVVWRFCTSGYEKHIMDVAQTKTSQIYIKTACRIFKAYVKSQPVKRTNFGSFMKSYYLKTIAMYCILYINIINGKELSGVKEALGYFLGFLGVCLEEERLPHFFYCNEWIKYMFPEYEPVDGDKVDLFESARKSGTLQNARECSWRNTQDDFRNLSQSDVFSDFKERFREFILAGRYCTACP